MKSRSLKQNCPPGCDGRGTIRGEDNGGDGTPQYPIYEVLRDCPVCGIPTPPLAAAPGAGGQTE